MSFVAIAAVVVMFLWNAIIPSVIGWGALTYLQAAGLIMLCRLLFGNVSSTKERANISLSRKDELRRQVKGMNREQRRDYIKNYKRNINDNE